MAELMQKFKRFITFGLVGCINTLIDFLVFTLCYTYLALTLEISQTAGYASGLVCSFLLNRRFTFSDRAKRTRAQLLVFIAVNAVSYGISVILMSPLTALLGNAYITKILVTGIVMLTNYFGYNTLVFKVKREGDENPD